MVKRKNVVYWKKVSSLVLLLMWKVSSCDKNAAIWILGRLKTLSVGQDSDLKSKESSCQTRLLFFFFFNGARTITLMFGAEKRNAGLVTLHRIILFAHIFSFSCILNENLVMFSSRHSSSMTILFSDFLLWRWFLVLNYCHQISFFFNVLNDFVVLILLPINAGLKK